jgi:hypothetical protein
MSLFRDHRLPLPPLDEPMISEVSPIIEPSSQTGHGTVILDKSLLCLPASS